MEVREEASLGLTGTHLQDTEEEQSMLWQLSLYHGPGQWKGLLLAHQPPLVANQVIDTALHLCAHTHTQGEREEGQRKVIQ